jgi:hypothetical protein
MEKSSLANIQSITTQLGSYDGSYESLKNKQTELQQKIGLLKEEEVKAGLSKKLNELSEERANNRSTYLVYKATHDPSSSLARELQKMEEYKKTLNEILNDSQSADEIKTKLQKIASIEKSVEVGDIATLIEGIREIHRETIELEKELDSQLALAKADEEVLKNKKAAELLRKQMEDAAKAHQKATLATLREKFKGIIGAVVDPTTGYIDITSKDSPKPKEAWVNNADAGAAEPFEVVSGDDEPDTESAPVSITLPPLQLTTASSTAALTAPAAPKSEEDKQLSKVQDILKRLLSPSEMDTFTKLYPGQTGDVRFMDALVAIITHYSGSLLVDKDETYKELMANNYDYLKILERNQKINFLLNVLDDKTKLKGRPSQIFNTDGTLKQANKTIQELISRAQTIIQTSQTFEAAANRFGSENSLKRVTISTLSFVPLLQNEVDKNLKLILLSKEVDVSKASKQILSSIPTSSPAIAAGATVKPHIPMGSPENSSAFIRREQKQPNLPMSPAPPAPPVASSSSSSPTVQPTRPLTASPSTRIRNVSTSSRPATATARAWRGTGGGTRRRNKIFRQKGGDATIIITPESSIYKKVVLGSLDQEGPDLEQTRDELLERELNNGSIRVYENNGPDVESSTTPLALAKSAVNSQVAMEHLMNSVDEHFKVKPGSADKTTLQRYKTLVRLCSASTAVQLIKELLKQNNTTTSLNDKQILTILGWNNSENLLFYNPNKNSNGGALLGGLFSLFSYSQGKFSYFLSQNCVKDYVCMLNWILLIAEHLNYEQDHSYTYENIRELVKNMYDCLFGFLERDRATLLPYFVNNTNVNFYKELVIKGLLGDKIFGDQTLKPIVDGIKNELQKMGGSPQQQPPPQPLQGARKTTVKLGGDERKKNKTRKHHNKKNNKSDHNTIKRHTRHRNLIKTAQSVSVSGSV